MNTEHFLWKFPDGIDHFQVRTLQRPNVQDNGSSSGLSSGIGSDLDDPHPANGQPKPIVNGRDLMLRSISCQVSEIIY